MARNYVEGTSSNDAGAAEVYRSVSVVPLGAVNAFVSSDAGALGPNGVALTTRVDEPSSSITYVGKAEVGESAANAVWQIFKVTTSGTETIITYADGDTSFNNVWANRASLTYV